MKINTNTPNDFGVNMNCSAPVSQWNFFLTRRNHAKDSYTASYMQASGTQASGYSGPRADTERDVLTGVEIYWKRVRIMMQWALGFNWISLYRDLLSMD